MKTVLLIDDNTALLSAFSALVQKTGCNTLTASSGRIGMVHLKDCVPDLILLDIMMEPMDGWETLRRIRAQESTSRVPVIMLTAKTLLPGDVLEHGPDIHGYIRKPLRFHELDAMLTSFWSEHTTIKEIMALAEEAGTSRHSILEYADLRRQIRVIQTMVRQLEHLMVISAPEEDSWELFHQELADIRDWLAEHRARYLVLEGEVEELGMISCL